MRRPRIDYTPAIADRICAELGRGRKLFEICSDDGMPSKGTVHGWVRTNLHGFGDRYRAYPHPRGIPLRYTRALADRICAELGDGRTLQDICSAGGMPSARAVSEWVKCDRDGFAARFREARDIGYLAMADEILEIADDARNDWMERRTASGEIRHVFRRENVMRSRARITARCWLLSKMLPRRFGAASQLAAAQEEATYQGPIELMQAIEARNRALAAKDAATDPAPRAAVRCCAACGRPLP